VKSKERPLTDYQLARRIIRCAAVLEAHGAITPNQARLIRSVLRCADVRRKVEATRRT